MDRRRFLSTMSVAGATAAVGYTAFSNTGNGANGAAPTSSLSTTTSIGSVDPTITADPTGGTEVPVTTAPAVSTAGRVLVVVQMNGGNDALNTLVPDDGRYFDARPDVSINQGEVLAIADGSGHGLHPAFEPLLARWNDGNVAAVAGVGYEGSSRSHFAAMDDWFSARPGTVSSTGWLGRWLDLTDDGSGNPMRSIALGGRGKALASELVPSTTVVDPGNFNLNNARDLDISSYRDGLERLGLGSDQTAVATATALESVDLFAEIVAGSTDTSQELSRRPSFTSLLATAGGLIERELGTEVIVVSGGGFDTHANQLDAHQELLSDVFGGVAAFLDRMEAVGRADDVLVMTTSEFGRRVVQNGSRGTDHGRAGVQFMMGSAVLGGLRGGWDLGRLTDGDLTPETDVRSLYQAGLDWLGGPTDEVLDRRYAELELLDSAVLV
ncbi:MAG: DUF1501 domain-containing protein [Actinobacteria bacterium]|nr:DUF1501 domain-containing protein [Actinomycetota bacterium]